MSRRLTGLALCGVLWGCSSTGDEPASRGRLQLREGRSMAEAPECSLEGPPCPAGTGCMSFTLEGVSHQRCLGGDACTEWVKCTGGTECVILESYPAQLRCAGKCTGADCDTSVSSPAP
ncbi:hypothetical protein [Melittangium boletus]|nr:hypothetical protein [Melittangium boletus]